jgi:thioredoxin-related protein
LEKVKSELNDTTLQILLVNTNDFDNKEKLIRFINAYNNTEFSFDTLTSKFTERTDPNFFNPLTISMVFANKKLKESYGVTAFPATILVNKRGFVYTSMIGYFEEYDT